MLLQMLLMTTVGQAAYSFAPSYTGVLRQHQYYIHVFESHSAPGTKHVEIDLHFVQEHVALGAKELPSVRPIDDPTAGPCAYIMASQPTYVLP